MHALGQLIRDCQKKDPSLSYERIANLTGHVNTASAIGKWGSKNATKLKDLPQPASINALATALKVSPVRILLAAAESAGINIADPIASEFAARLPANIDDLPDEEQQALIVLAWKLSHKND